MNSFNTCTNIQGSIKLSICPHAWLSHGYVKKATLTFRPHHFVQISWYLKHLMPTDPNQSTLYILIYFNYYFQLVFGENHNYMSPQWKVYLFIYYSVESIDTCIWEAIFFVLTCMKDEAFNVFWWIMWLIYTVHNVVFKPVNRYR